MTFPQNSRGTLRSFQLTGPEFRNGSKHRSVSSAYILHFVSLTFVQSLLSSSLDISRAKCVTLACYSMQELDSYANQGSLAREQWFENVKPVPWAKVPHHLWAIINDRFTVVFPPYLVRCCPSYTRPLLTESTAVPR